MSDTQIDDSKTRASVEKAMDLLSAFGEDAHIGIGVSELARRAQLSKSTAHRLLAILEESGAIERSGRDYRHGPLLHKFTRPMRSLVHDALRDLLTPYLADLYELTHLTVHLAVLHGDDVIYLNKLHGFGAVRSPSKIGGRAPAYSTGVGKAMLAFDQAAQLRLPATKLVAWTPTTIADHDALADELARVRSRGLAFDRGETNPDVCCIAAPVIGPRGQALAGLSISGRRNDFSPSAHAEQLRTVARMASRAVAGAAAHRAVPGG